MPSKSCYVKLLDGVAKSLFRHVFLNMLTMELEFDAIYEIKVFGCNHSFMNNDDDVGICYIECESSSACINMMFMLNDVFSDQNYEICADNDVPCFEHEFQDGFILWQI